MTDLEKRVQIPELENVYTSEADLPAARKSSGLRGLDIFAGVGGLSLAAESLGIYVTCAVELEAAQAATYALNHKATPVLQKDIRKIDHGVLEQKLGRVDVVFGGVPCEPFSVATVRGTTPSHPPNLINYARDLVEKFKPKFFLFENVPRAANDNRWKRAASILEKAGYKVGLWIVQHDKVGGATTRKRVFFVGKLAGQLPAPPRETNGRSFHQAVGNLPLPGSTSDPLHQRRSPPSPSSMINFRLRQAGKNPGDYGRYVSTGGPIDPSKPSRPIVTSPAGLLLPQKGGARVLTSREVVILQDFPKSFRFLDPGPHITRMLGDVVPVKLGKAVFAALLGKAVKKALRPSLKVPDPDHLISRLAKREVAGILSRVDRAAFLDKDFILVNERLKEGEPTKAWGVVRLRTGVPFKSGTQAVETLGQKLDALTRREFRQEKDAVYFHSLMLVERFDPPREVGQQTPGRRFTGQVDAAEKQEVNPERLASLSLDNLLALLRIINKEFTRRKEEGATEASSENLVNAAVFVLGELRRRGEKPPDLPIVQAAGALLKADVRITTSTDAGHSHTAIVDEDTGDGETTVNAGHKHAVNNWRVLPSGDDNHIHTIERPAVKRQIPMEKKLSDKQRAELEAENEKICENKKRPEAKAAHRFKSAEWTHPNGHPRCLVCGVEESMSGWCNSAARDKAADRDYASGKLTLDDMGRKAAERYAGVGKREYADVAASGEDSGELIKLGDVLPAFQTVLLRKPAVMLVGGLAVRKETKNDIDILIRGPMDDATRHVIKFRLGRMLAAKDPELADRIQFHDDEYGGPFTDFVELFDLALVARDKPEIIQMRSVEKQGDPLLELLPKGAGPADAVYQLHARGASVHGDLRMKINGHLVGFTLAVQKAGAVPDINTVAQGRALLAGLTLKGNRIHKPLLAPSRVRAFPKKRQPVVWLEARDQVIEPGDVGATAEEEGVLIVADRPKFEQGRQSSRFHEYFFTGKGKLFQGVMFFRLLASRGEATPQQVEEGTRTREGETFWVSSFSKNALPSILGTRAVRRGDMPPPGRSWIPQSLERVTPEEFRYWEKTGAAAKAARDALVKARFFTDANVKVVDGQFRRVVEKRYVDLKGLAPSKPSPPEPVAKQRTVDFSLAWQTFKGPEVVRTGPTRQAWWLMWPTDGKVAAFRLETDPVAETGDIAATFQEMTDKSLMTFQGDLEPGKRIAGFVPNPTKDTPSQWRIVDKGKLAILDEEAGKIRFSLKGANLKGTFLLEQEEPGAALWKLKREDVVKAARKISAVVLSREEQGYGWVYSVGVGPVSKSEASQWKNTVEVDGETWVCIGKTLTTNVDTSPGKTIQATFAELSLDTRDQRSLTWSVPVVKDVIEGRPSTIKEVEALVRPDEVDKLADLPFTRPLPLLKSDALQYVLGIVLEPNDGKDGAPLAPDAQSDIYSEDEIRKAAWLFMRKYQGLGLMHERVATKREMEIVESYLAPVDFVLDGQKIRKGTWLLGAKIHSPELWAKIKRGEIGAWSIDGEAVRQPLDGEAKAA